MAKTTYTLGTFGGGGCVVNGAGGQLFEALDNGEYTNKKSAMKAAAELAQSFAQDTESGSATVAIVYAAGDERATLLTAAVATRGSSRVNWI